MKTPIQQQPHERCKAKSRSGEQCKRRPIKGGKVCVLHGGKAPRTIAAAQRNLQTAALEKAITTYGLPRDIPAHQALREEQARTVGAVDWLEQIIRAQDPDALTWGLDEETEKGAGEFPGTDSTKRARPSVWVQIFQAERKHLHEIAKTVIQLDLDKRRVELDEAIAAPVAGAIRAILGDLGLSAEQEALVAVVVPRHLRAITGGQATLDIEGEVVGK